MIKNISISGLKSIDKLDVECGNLNIITGTNSSGKSTFLQAIMLFFQSHRGLSIKPIENGLNGRFVSLGEFRENKNPNSETINITLDFDNSEDCSSTITFAQDHNLECFVNTNDFINTPFEKYCESVFENIDSVVKYLSCNRVGAQDVYAKGYSTEGVGKNGEYAIFHLEKNKSLLLNKELIRDNNSETLATQVNYWLEYIVNTTIKTEDIIGTDIVKATYTIRDTGSRRPKNIGSGISYLISVLVMCLAANKNDVLVIENPEIHLHPKAQSKVCEFLYFIANSGIQVFVETHSDHIFNGIRAGIARNTMDDDKVVVNFFDLDENDCTNNTVVKFGKRGRILNNVEGLFDQFDIDLNKMLNL